MTFKKISLCGLLIACLAPSAMAQPPRSAPPPTGEAPPETPSGRTVGQAVFFSPSGEVFKAPLKDPYPVVLWFNGADTNKDGALSPDEFLADAMRFFAIVDRDGRGVITSQDNTYYETELAPEITGFSPLVAQPRNPRTTDEDGDKTGAANRYIKSVQGAAQFSLINEPQPIRAADANFDYRITIEEWTRATSQRFRLLDANKDGKLTLDELPKTPLQKGLEQRAAEREKDQKKKGGLFGGW
ncbi:ef-hand domain protein [Asticcacaulis sp. DW145]|uniref:EF-hand domain-containing protein n=1 Tax=Asticcacaulis currens TaxID=2984210 RepID=A0ABT5IHF5_9CAUL|nr:hypothetical protein [Asticcacaulis currens]MDC7695599.1 hypothetical protein [Asticcacaulis currens]BEV11852.1 ef-hand domain protein [Asticcacaulis sp. DW145]